MARKKQYDYFKTMELLAKNGHTAAEHLEQIIKNFNVDTLEADSKVIHDLEKTNDDLIDELTNELYDAFITPIDREDILIISERLDNIIDDINSMTYLFENLVITQIRPGVEEFGVLVNQAVQGVHEAILEFPKFKNSKKMKQLIFEVNAIESKADLLYSQLKRELFSNEQNPIEVIKWKEILERFEAIVNECETAVDVIDGMIIKNT